MIKKLALTYHKLLMSVDWDDDLLVYGLREGLNKFLSNAYLTCTSGKSKYHKSHYISGGALERLLKNDCSGLVFEHMVPKSKYIQEPCEKLARLKQLTPEFVEQSLTDYWKLATITKQEDEKLSRLCMPKDWDHVDIFARYRAAQIELVLNQLYQGGS